MSRNLRNGNEYCCAISSGRQTHLEVCIIASSDDTHFLSGHRGRGTAAAVLRRVIFRYYPRSVICAGFGYAKAVLASQGNSLTHEHNTSCTEHVRLRTSTQTRSRDAYGISLPIVGGERIGALIAHGEFQCGPR